MYDNEWLCEELTSDPPTRKCLFFVGSGISSVPPSALPSAQAMLRATLAELARDDVDEVAGTLLPEVAYEILEDYYGPAVFNVWESLEQWKEPQWRQQRIGPNAGHHAVVELAARWGTPVVTTNFDTMLEAAAEDLGLIARVWTPSSTGSTAPTPASGSREVCVWKLHGDALDLARLRTTLSGITHRDDSVLHQLQRAMLDRDVVVCFIGYSGFDLDLFPWISQFELRRPIWVDVRFSEAHRVRFIHQARPVITSGVDWARLTLETLRVFPRVAGTTPNVSITARFTEHCLDVARTAMRETTGGDSVRRTVAQAALLAAVGDNRAATQRLSATGVPLEPGLAARYWLLRANVAHETARYESMEVAASHASRSARRAGSRALRWHSRITTSFARKQQYLPGFNFRDVRSLTQPGALRCLAWMCVVAAWGSISLRPYRHADGERLRAYHAWIEHVVRVGGLLHAGLGRTWLGRLVLRRWWRYVRKRSISSGYGFGIANAQKYLSRLGIDPDDDVPSTEGAEELFRMLTAQTGLALVYRDRADLLVWRASRDDLASSEQESMRTEAARLYEAAITTARDLGDPSIELKCMIQLWQLQRDRPLDRATIARLCFGIESPWLRKIEPELLDRVTRPVGDT